MQTLYFVIRAIQLDLIQPPQAAPSEREVPVFRMNSVGGRARMPVGDNVKPFSQRETLPWTSSKEATAHGNHQRRSCWSARPANRLAKARPRQVGNQPAPIALQTTFYTPKKTRCVLQSAPDVVLRHDPLL
jgi:hypothetical protein